MGKIIKGGISYGGNGGGSDTSSYTQLTDKPSINNVELNGNKSLSDLGINIPSKTSDLNNDSGFITSIDSETPPFTEAQSRTNISSGDTVSTILGKIAKFFTDLANVAFSGSYNDLTDQPTIPTVNNATLTIQKNGTDVQTFTANQSTDATANITVPTKTSDLNNDSNFIQDNPTFTEAQTRANIVSGETFATILGKIMKFFSDLKTVAFTNSYTDLDNKPTIPSAQIQSDWSQSDNTQVNYIKNKPTIPTVNNATLTIQKNGATVNTFTANASSNVTANITVPTKTSEITNDSNFVTSTSTTWKNIVGAWSSAVQANVGATSISVSNPMNSTNVTVDPFCENSSGTQIGIKTMSVTASTITLTFDALTVATTFKCRVMSN